MKSTASLRTFLLLAGSSLFAITYAHASTLYWDSDGVTAGFGSANGTWGTDAYWSTVLAGTGTTANSTTAWWDDIFFGTSTNGYAGTIALNGTQSARLLTFGAANSGTVTLTAGTLSLGNGGGITVEAGAANDATISSNLTISGSQIFNVSTGRTLTLDTGTFTRNAGATLNIQSAGTVTSTMTNLAAGSMVNGIIGPWASFGTGASTKYATFSGNDIVGLTGTAAATAANVTSVAGTFNYDVAGGNATLGAGANINTLRYTGSGATIGGALTTNGIMNVGGGGLTLSGTITSGSGDLVISAPSGSITFSNASGTINNNGNMLVVDGPGTVTMKAGIISGSGGLIKNGSGFLEIGGQYSAPVHTYSGPTIINGGIVRYEAATLPSGNITINNGVFEKYWTGTFSRTLGSSAGEVQILGGNSGFAFGSTGSIIRFNNSAAFEVVWGAANEAGNVLSTGFFNPSTFVFGAANTGSATFENKLDLNGTSRTIQTTAQLTMSGVIRTSSGTAGLIKTGAGELVLSNAANTFSGSVAVNGGTLTVSTLANGGSNSGLGASSNAAGSLLLGNGSTLKYTGGAVSTNRGFTINGTAAGHGASLDASGSGAVNFNNTASPAYGTVDQSRTLTLTGTNTGSNTLAANIVDNGTGAVSVNKTGAGLWVLSNTSNSYTGPTTLTAGTLSVAAASNLGGGSSNLVFDGGTLQMTGTGLTSLSGLGRTVLFNTGKTVGLDINDASNVFTADQTLNQGTGGLTKTGAGTLVLNQANTYTGVTTISAGTLRLDTGGSVLGSVINNGVLLVNKIGALTSGTDFPALIGGSGSFAIGASATYEIASPTGLQFNALNTTGGGSFSLSGVTTPVFGGLVGTTGNLSSSFSSGYTSGASNLTLNMPAGTTFTYGGVINDGAGGMDLTKAGAGTQILTGNNTYTGTTFLNGGTLTLGSGTGKISGTTAITFNGGTLQFNRSGITDLAAIPDGAPITVNSSSTFGATSADAGNANANETIGAVTLNAGQMNFNWTNGGSSGTQMILTSLSRSGTASANFNSGFATNNSRWKVTGAGTTTAGQIVGPWYTTGGNNAGFASTDYAVFSSDFVAQANIAGSAQTGWTTAANAYTNALAAQTLTATRTITALRNTGATATLTLASGFNLETYGLLNGVSTLFTVAPGTGGVLTTPTGGGNLYITAGAGAITVNAPINNNSGNVTLVKNGGNTLTLGSTTSSYSGGTVINAGTVSFTADTNFGAAGTGITFNGSAILSSPSNADTSGVIDLGSRSVTLNNGAVATLTGTSRLNLTIGGAVTGSGGVIFQQGGFWTKARLNSTSNTFSGGITVASTGDDGNSVFSVNSIADGAGYGAIILNNTSADGDFIGLDYGTGGANGSGGGGATAPLTLDYRQIVVATNANNLFNNSSNQAVTINTDIGFSGTGARSIVLGRQARAGSGLNTFAGKLTDNVGGALTVTAGGGTWIFSGANTYSGITSVSAGTLQIGSNSVGTVGAITSSAIGTGGLTFGGGGLASNSTTARTILNPVAFTGNATLGNATNTGKLTFSADAALGGATRTLTLDSDAEFAGVVSSSGAFGITKAGAGTLRLSNTNTYTGVTTISAGVLEASVLANGGSNSSIGASANTATNLSLDNGATFRYVGSSDVTTDRGFRVNGTSAGHGATIESSGSGTLSFDNTIAINWGSNNQTRTLTLGGTNTGANTIGKVIANNGSGATSIVKSDGGTWVLNQANTYTGNTTVNAGTLQFAKMTSLNNNVDTNWTAAKINVKNAATLAMNVDSAGINGFTAAKLNTLLTNISVANSATTGLQAGAILGFDTSTASGGTFTQGNAIANSTGANGGAIGLTKLGTGTLVLDKANTYSGATTINGGILEISVGGSTHASSAVSVNNSASLIVNGTVNGTLLANSSTTVSGTGTVSGNATIQGIHNPGNSPGIQTFGNLAYTGGASVVNWELTDNTVGNLANPNAIFDQIIVGGDLDFTALTTLNLSFSTGSVLWSDAFWGSSQSWTLYDVAGTTNDFVNLSLNTINWLDSGNNAFNTARSGSYFSLSQSGQDILINYTYVPIPEPRAALLGGIGLLLLLRRRRS